MATAILEIFLSPFIEICKDPFVEYVVLPIKRRVSYPFTYKTKLQRLQDLTGKLKDKRDRLQDSIGDAERNGEVVYVNVTNWLSESEKAIEDAMVAINAEEEAAKMRCFLGLCPNLKTRYLLSKKAVKEASAIDQLNQQESDLHPFSHRPHLQQHADPSVFALEELQSRLSILKQIMEALKDPNLNRVGVWGMGGVGKSTLAKEVHGLASKEKLFDDVIFVPVSEKPELGEIQKIIAAVLGLNFDVEDRLVRASHLFQRIKDKKTLIILDNIWQKIDLNQIGIPTGADGKDCKILLTSREKHILLNEMGAEKEFMLQILTLEEACSMFAKTVPHAKDPEFDAVAI
ncbi:probable disease resistance protein At1g62630 [Mercurialis annua]|uniref:probable disease resistance protein At1g62630 n=1 Tax=Mercurialis annua TaxID=3986 RepID=UPI002160ED7F|nr:probable disease resistance protein At1g62630 [Mercurialis annua]XP_050237759.1 probable disease resistance protein At1g62630 [Mercurialis annua]